jgi:hypothetical protein
VTAVAAEQQPQVRRGPDPAGLGHVFDAEVGGFEQLFGVLEPMGGKPPLRRDPRLGQEAPRKRARCPAGLTRERGDGERLGEMLERPIAGAGETLAGGRCGAITMRRATAAATLSP